MEAERLCDALGEIFCLTFIQHVDPAQALGRMGAYPDTLVELDPDDMYERRTSFDAGYPTMAGAVAVGGWTLILEPYGFEAAGTLLAEMSRGTVALSVLRHDYAHPHFTYAVDGVELVTFDPEWMDSVWGAEPHRLLAPMHTVGFDPVDSFEDAEMIEDAVPRMMRLASVITGVTPTPEMLTAPMLAAQIEPWFTSARPNGGSLYPDPANGRPEWNTLVEAIAAASPTAQRAAALGEARRLSDLFDLGNVPGLAEVLADAEAGRPARVLMDSPLGKQVREWLRLSSLAHGSLNDPLVSMSADARDRGGDLGWFARVLRGALYPDPDIAVRTALYGLGFESSSRTDHAAHAAALRRLCD